MADNLDLAIRIRTDLESALANLRKMEGGVAGVDRGLSPRVRGNRGSTTTAVSRPGSIPACAGEPWVTSPRVCLTGVYPRVCGGTCSELGWPPTAAGLSPRVRGNPPRRILPARGRRSIPACAGEPSPPSAFRARQRVYPRVCGGTRMAPGPDVGDEGLSPRVRGNPSSATTRAGRVGSIPACAGEPRDRGAAPVSGLSPRVRGNQHPRLALRVARGLSPPRVRGNQHPPPAVRRGVAVEIGGLSPRRGNPPRRHRMPGRRGSIPACAGELSAIRERHDPQRVYPRVCGGTLDAGLDPKVVEGLSPRVRGNRPGRQARRVPAGSIPACAGEPRPYRAGQGPPRVYPRVCGGTELVTWKEAGFLGLSPRVRGNRHEVLRLGKGLGSIPACAGEPTPSGSALSDSRVYPRVCGETHGGKRLGSTIEGLSPRVRGNQPIPSRRWNLEGSIPACAGEPEAGRGADGSARVYPRVCGGTPRRPAHPLALAGLSPRVRGNPAPPGAPACACGSIPACAGEPRPPSRGSRPRRVYPRVCGGTENVVLFPARGTGLSPRVRGNLLDPLAHRRPRGSIPACAGEPRPCGGSPATRRVYPRVCGGTAQSRIALDPARGHVRSIPACAGEPWAPSIPTHNPGVYPRVCGGTQARARLDAAEEGLSPRVRGNRDHGAGEDRAAGSIPACAGEPDPWRSRARR